MSHHPHLPDALRWIIAILRKHRIPFQVTGGLAAHFYGSQRPINDIDIDVPEEAISAVVPDVQQYRVFGPARYEDGAWDVFLMTLEYRGQLIDIGGAEGTRIRDGKTSKWTPVHCDLLTANEKQLFGTIVPVVDPHDLIAYKEMLTGEHQQEDIAAVKKYLRQESSQ
ncbi:MAG: hypothetical protein Q7R81_06335 [Candidatus Peregrinibacteria bacterium]|nr:hypothetical protein [Candidatus Peregrinibacteria bacterium]